MRISHERLIFALSVLDGEEGAHRILADLLEEEGDRGLAEWARAKKGKRHRRIDFVLALLPHQISLRLASDFLVRSLTLLDAHQWRGSPEPSTQRLSLSPAIEAVRGIGQWSQGSSTDEALEPATAGDGSSLGGIRRL